METQKHLEGVSALSQQTITPNQPTDMSSQDYFSARPIPISPRPEHVFLAQVAGRALHKRNTSAASTASTTSNRNFLHPCPSDIGNSPSQRAISFSSWTHYNPSAPCSPAGALKASLLCKASGTTSSYDPPASEWTFLDEYQPVYVGKPIFHRRGKASGSSSTLSEMSLPGDEVFAKQPIKRASTSSQLTASIRAASQGGGLQCTMSAAQRHGLGGMTCDHLPSAFDDSDDEED